MFLHKDMFSTISCWWHHLKQINQTAFFNQGCGNIGLKLSSSHSLIVFPFISLNDKDIDAILRKNTAMTTWNTLISFFSKYSILFYVSSGHGILMFRLHNWFNHYKGYKTSLKTDKVAVYKKYIIVFLTAYDSH